MLEDLLGLTATNQLARLLAGARVYVGASPDLIATRVVEDHAFAHAGGAHRLDGVGARGRGRQCLANALADQAPIALGLEHLRALRSGPLWM